MRKSVITSKLTTTALVLAALTCACGAAHAESESGFCFGYVGSYGSESGGPTMSGGESESGGVLWGDSSSESGGVYDNGAESESGGALNSGAESETGGPHQAGSESQATVDGNRTWSDYVRYYDGN